MSQTELNRPTEMNLEVLMNVPVSLSVEVGRTEMTIGQLLETGEGSVRQLARSVDAPLDIYVNDAPVARGIVVVQDESFGIQITELINQGTPVASIRSEEPSAS